jgi:gas vesicle protein
MAENNGASKLAYFVIGFGFGAVVALLFAPKSGRELREDIAESTRRGIDKASEAYETTRTRTKELAAVGREKAAGIIEEAKESVVEQRERLSAAIEAGKQAYREEKQRIAEGS